MATEEIDSCCLAAASYIFVRVLGSGAFGEAVLYQKTEDSSLVVWKEVNLTRLNEKQQRDSQSEIDILSLLNHANIISYYNHFIDENTLFIEMEYANGGTLHEKIYKSTKLWLEEDVLWYFYQLTSALAYIHDFGIIHRDIKTLNIFLTKVGLVKLGDFGISRFLESKNQMAETLVGTPYYMSPEIMKGEKYNFKSDIWALGCVLYEMLTLEKIFQATNPLKLAMQIVKSDHSSVNECYSSEMSSLVDLMLSKKPQERPTAEDILTLPLFGNSNLRMEQRVYELNSVTRRARMSATSTSNTVSIVTSKMCENIEIVPSDVPVGWGKLTPQKLELFTREKSPMQVAVGHSHFAAITFEKELYTWANLQGGASMVGQLGHGDTSSCKTPKLVETLLGVPIQQVSCGEDFTLCVSDVGGLYAFGSNYYGCLGCEEDDEVLSPVHVEFFLEHPVQEIACGDAHVIVLTKSGDIYTWGCGEFGRLGSGTEEDYRIPHKIDLPGKHQVKHVCAGGDSTFLVCFNGRLLACGSNQFNKLGFNSQTSGLRKRKANTFDIPCRHSFSTVKPLNRFSVVHVSAGKNHSGIIDSFGYLYMFGCNKFGQLGVGDFKPRPGVCRVAGVLVGQRVEKLACGDEFTVVATNEKVLKQKTLKSRVSSSKSTSRESLDSILESEQQIHEAGIVSDVFGDLALPDVAEVDNFSPDVFSLPLSQPASANILLESSIPIWLQQELNEAEVIPIPAPKPVSCEVNLSVEPSHHYILATLPQSDVGLATEAPDRNVILTLGDQDTISLLTARIVKLEEENTQLKRIVSEQARLIDNLKGQLP